MKRFILLLIAFIACFVVSAQEVVPPTKSFFQSLDLDSIINIGLGFVAFIFGTGWMLVKAKIRKAGELLIKFADAVDDNKIDANERTDLSDAARNLVQKK